MKRACVRILSSKAEVTSGTLEALEATLTVKDPKRFFSKAYKEKRWDGVVKLYDGRSFPAGLADRVIDWFAKNGHEVTVLARHEKKDIDTARMTKDYLPAVGKFEEFWEPQYQAILAMLNNPRGVIKSPTGSGKTEMMCAVARYLWEERGWRSVVMLPRKGLLVQTVERFERYYQGDIEVGMYGDGVCRPGPIAVGTAQTLISFMPRRRKAKILPVNKEIREMLRTYEVLFLDETHHASSDSWYEIAMYSRAIRRYGLSGTPLKGNDISDLKMIGATGPVLYDCEATVLIDLKLAAKPKILMIMSDVVSGPELPHVWMRKELSTGKMIATKKRKPYKVAYEEGVVENEGYNRAVIRAATWLVDYGKQTLILCRRKAHWMYLHELLEEQGVDFRAVWGDTQTAEREEAKHLLGTGGINLVLASTIFDEGEDVPGIDAMVLAEGIKSNTNVIQRVGRGMRRKEGDNDVWIVDFIPTCHYTLIDHGMARSKAYTAEGYETRLQTVWPDEDSDEPLLQFDPWVPGMEDDD